ncbi:MAG TPA: VWA domain-containing protein [Sandaracinaceae bacterium LLY-WYZ-13_1]|nr:VWA domain-containing protein [Sandaracinaceae bacterium LLY-WYZ-13_1]
MSLQTRRVVPTVTLVVDQSLSMESELGDGVSRWDSVHRVLTGSDGLVTELQGYVRFGLALYSDTQGGSSECPRITVVPPGLEAAPAIDATFRAAAPMGETPTGDALQHVIDGLTLDPTDDPNVIVVATDGNPDRCGAPDAHDGASRAQSVAAVQRAFALGIRSYVIGVGRGSVEAAHLAALARHGVGRDDAPYWEADDLAGLAEALRIIVRGELSCIVALEGRVDPVAACSGEVRLDGEPLACDAPDGWRLVDESHLELTGASCDALLEGDTRIEATFPCHALLI